MHTNINLGYKFMHKHFQTRSQCHTSVILCVFIRDRIFKFSHTYLLTLCSMTGINNVND